MTMTRLLVQIVIAVVCAGVATMLLPRKIPGKALGLLVIGLAGVWLGEWVIHFLQTQYNLTPPEIVLWSIQGVPILPAIAGSAIILYVVTAFISWGRYGS